ncbi:sortase [Bryobacterales bacterium F-183]|nr:sortase [Bryobacterales bacterium F-183]
MNPVPRVRVQYQFPGDGPGFVLLAVRWMSLSLAMACFAWAAYVIYDQYSYQDEADTLFQQAIQHQDETPVPAAPSEPAPAKEPPVLSQIKRPVAKLEIPRLGVAGYVEDGLDSKTLRRAIGHAAWSAQPGQDGNVVMAAHRDTFFSGLRGVKLGDAVMLQSPELKKKHRYVVTKIFVVNPEDTWVMQPVAQKKMLTLITCYPFSFIGHAPQRLIVQGQLIEDKVAPKAVRQKRKSRTRRNRI